MTQLGTNKSAVLAVAISLLGLAAGAMLLLGSPHGAQRGSLFALNIASGPAAAVVGWIGWVAARRGAGHGRVALVGMILGLAIVGLWLALVGFYAHCLNYGKCGY